MSAISSYVFWRVAASNNHCLHCRYGLLNLQSAHAPSSVVNSEHVKAVTILRKRGGNSRPVRRSGNSRPDDESMHGIHSLNDRPFINRTMNQAQDLRSVSAEVQVASFLGAIGSASEIQVNIIFNE